MPSEAETRDKSLKEKLTTNDVKIKHFLPSV
jgi:hypothetical protein